MHRDRHLVGVARHLWRDQHRRMGFEARLRGRVYRQGYGKRAARPRRRYGAADRRDACHGGRSRPQCAVSCPTRCRPARRDQRGPSEQVRLQARPLAAQSGEGLGAVHPAGGRVRLLGTERAIRPRPRPRPDATRHPSAQHDGHRIEYLQRRGRGDRRCRAGFAWTDRWCRRLRTGAGAACSARPRSASWRRTPSRQRQDLV